MVGINRLQSLVEQSDLTAAVKSLHQQFDEQLTSIDKNAINQQDLIEAVKIIREEIDKRFDALNKRVDEAIALMTNVKVAPINVNVPKQRSAVKIINRESNGQSVVKELYHYDNDESK